MADAVALDSAVPQPGLLALLREDVACVLQRIKSLEARLAAAGLAAPQACHCGCSEGSCECAASVGDVGGEKI